MQALGNDFVLIDSRETSFHLTGETLQRLADRHLGIGCDQFLIIERSSIADVHYRVFNADGTAVEHCGNGARCLAKYLFDNGCYSSPIKVSLINRGIIELMCLDNGSFATSMPIAECAPALSLSLEGEGRTFFPANVGNPHAVSFVDDIKSAPVNQWGAFLQNDRKHFPNRVNVEFVQIINPQHIKMRVFERGVGETQACGTGACAAALIACAQGFCDMKSAPLRVEMQGGSVEVMEKNHTLFLIGEAHSVFEGDILIS